ncbi:MAG: hypothetical protein Q7T70_16500 [Polaromonas sp.]|nr:hypothetical protein [Polaromonas sp.]
MPSHAPAPPVFFSSRAGKLAALGCAGLLASTAAWAEPSPALDRFSLSLGAFHADPKFSAGVDTSFGRLDSGTVERDKVTLPRVKADLLIFDSQGLSFDYYRYSGNYSGALVSNTTVGGGTVTTTGAASVDAQIDFAKLAYKWWLGSGNTVLGLGAGAAYYRLSLDARATAAIGGVLGGATGAINESYSDDTAAPLLEAGLRHAINPSLRLFADVSGAKKSSGRVQGEIYNAAVGIEWFPLKNVGLVFDYGLTDIDLRREGGNNANFRMKLKGPSAFVKVRF